MKPDAELLRCYASEGSEAAFAEFVRRHLNLVYSAALRRAGGNAHWAGDIAQQVFAAAARQAGTLSRHASVTGWLYTATRNAAHNLMRDELRRKAREQAAQADSELLAPAAANPEWERLRPLLDTAMDELSERDREAVLLRFFEGRALAEVGSRLGLSDNAARMRVERALDKLRGALARRGLTSTAAALGVALAHQAVAAAPAALAGSVAAAAVAGGGAAAGVGVIGFMMANKLSLGTAAAVIAGGAFGVSLQSQAHASLAAELAALHQQQAALEEMRAENRLLAQRAQEANLLRIDDQEYARLENEIAAARRRLTQAEATEVAAAGARQRELARMPVYAPGDLDVRPVAIRQAPPQISEELRKSGRSGEVVVDFVVDADGRASEVKATSSTYEALVPFAVDAGTKWQFRPGRKNDSAVNTQMRVPIVFNLNTDPAHVKPPASPGDKNWSWF